MAQRDVQYQCFASNEECSSMFILCPMELVIRDTCSLVNSVRSWNESSGLDSFVPPDLEALPPKSHHFLTSRFGTANIIAHDPEESGVVEYRSAEFDWMDYCNLLNFNILEACRLDFYRLDSSSEIHRWCHTCDKLRNCTCKRAAIWWDKDNNYCTRPVASRLYQTSALSSTWWF